MIDEAIERDGEEQIEVEPPVEEQSAVDSDAFGGPAVFGGEEVPAQAGATIERDWTVEVRETAYGEIPTPPSTPTSPRPHSSIRLPTASILHATGANTPAAVIDAPGALPARDTAGDPTSLGPTTGTAPPLNPTGIAPIATTHPRSPTPSRGGAEPVGRPR